MSIEGTQGMGNWGKKIPVNGTQHISQTNVNASDGYGVHITTGIPGMGIKIHDRLDSGGNYLGNNFAQK